MKTPFEVFFYGKMLFMCKNKNNKLKLILTAAILLTTGLATSASADEVVHQHFEIRFDNIAARVEEAVHTAEKVQEMVQKQEQEIAQHTAEKTREEKIVETANRYQGVLYVYGGTTPAGFDCSGFTSYVYREALGQEIGRTTWAQIGAGQQVSVADAKVGDVLVFFGGNHVGIYLGNGQFIHAPQPGDVVSVSSLATMPADFALRI